MSDNNTNPPPAKATRIRGLYLGICVGMGTVAGRLAADAVGDSLGWWGSIAIATLAAAVGSLIALFIMQIWQRPNSKGSNP